MAISIRRGAMATTAAAFALLALAVPASGQGSRGAPRPALAYSVSDRVNAKHAEALELLSDEQYDEALKVLGRLRMRSMNPLERAKTHQLTAYVYNGKGDFEKTAERLSMALAEDVFTRQRRTSILYELIQVQSALARWDDVVANLERWFDLVEDPNPDAYYMLAVAYYELDDLDAALEPARTAVEMADEPRQSWLQLLLALRLTRQEYEESIPLLETLASRFPRKTWFVQLSTVHGALGNYEEALIPLQLAYANGYLDEDPDLRKLGQMLLFLDLPYRAAEVIAEGLTKGVIEEDQRILELLGNSRIAAREYEDAVGPLEAAARLAENGDLSMRLAQVHLQREAWGNAIEALELALEKGVDSPGQVQLLMGIAYYSQDEKGKALGWFSRASSHETTRQQASSWMAFIERELGAEAG